MAENYIKGTPPAVLLPAKNYAFKVSENHYKITVPRQGTYHDLDPEFFPEDAGDFSIYDEESKTLFMPSITKVLFAAKKYPALKFNQFFVPYSIKFEKDEVVIIGQVVDMLIVKEEEGV